MRRIKTKYSEFKVNGVKVAIYPMKSVRSVVIRACVRAGSWYEKGPRWGALHLLEHLMLDGSANIPTELEVEKYKERHGISNNASTSGSKIEFWYKFPYDKLEEGMKLFEEMVFRPLIKRDDLAREIKVIEQEYVDKWSDPYNRFFKAVREHMVGTGNPYARDGIGQPEYLKSFTRRRLVEAHRRFFVPDNMCIAVAGRVNEEGVRNKLERILSGFERGREMEGKFGAVRTKKGTLWHKEDLDQVVLSVIWKLPGAKKMSLKERYALNQVRYILGGSARSRLFRELRMRDGLVYKTGASLFSFPTYGEFEIWSSTNGKNYKRTYEKMRKIIDEFAGSLNRSEFESAMGFLNMGTFLRFDSVGSISGEIASDLFYEGRFYPPEERVDIGSSVTLEYLKRVYKKYLAGGDFRVCVMAREKLLI